MGISALIFIYDNAFYFESKAMEDMNLWKTDLSKDGKHSKSTNIFLGLLVGLGGMLNWYDIFEGKYL